MSKKDNANVFSDEVYNPPIKKNYGSKMTIMKSVDDTWSPDLLDMVDCNPSDNREYSCIFVVLGKFSNFGWTIPLKNKYGQTTTDEFSKIMKTSKRKTNHFETDDGEEVINKLFNEFL